MTGERSARESDLEEGAPNGGFKEEARRRGEIMFQSRETACPGAWRQVVHLEKGKQIRPAGELCWPSAGREWGVGKTVSREKPREVGRGQLS